MVKKRKVIRGVECRLEETYLMDGQRARVVIPEKIDGKDLEEFVYSSYAEGFPEPETRKAFALIFMRLYYNGCDRFLIYKRQFDIYSLSSPMYRHQLKEVRQLPKFVPTTVLLRREIKSGALSRSQALFWDNIRLMVELGRSSEPKSWEDLLRGAIYRHPDRLPRPGDAKDFQGLMRKYHEDLERRTLRRIGKLGEPQDQVWREWFTRFGCLLVFQAEHTTFNVLHQAMEKVYERIKGELSSNERALFRFWYFKNPKYLHRIIAFDPSPVTSGLGKLLMEVYHHFGVKKGLRILQSPTIETISTAYLNFYPIWLHLVLDEEAERRYEAKKREEEGAARRHEDRERKEELDPWVFYGDDLEREKDKRDYSTGSFDEMLRTLKNLPWPYDKKPVSKTSKPRKKVRRERVKEIPPDLQRKIIGFEADGLSNKEIACHLGLSPSYTSKLRKKVNAISESIRDEQVWKLLSRQIHRNVRRIYDGLPTKEKAWFRNWYVGEGRKRIQQLSRDAHLDSKKMEMRLIPPFLRR